MWAHWRSWLKKSDLLNLLSPCLVLAELGGYQFDYVASAVKKVDLIANDDCSVMEQPPMVLRVQAIAVLVAFVQWDSCTLCQSWLVCCHLVKLPHLLVCRGQCEIAALALCGRGHPYRHLNNDLFVMHLHLLSLYAGTLVAQAVPPGHYLDGLVVAELFVCLFRDQLPSERIRLVNPRIGKLYFLLVYE